ncbi:DUF1559 domain-containing protein [Lentisphaera marina]|uniref:DUF1559 family PulG-like putative transporter n=1 Tax=Lentisphaera marina TaxID=1111041 RepID=UPI0023656089|nr:DUF1559 domain-containing protein [Lentisphaera marina]MDD7986690.1 DUF1559 domain-containing protein [Lentisphaera marina]
MVTSVLNKKSKSSFSLIELLVVIAIVGILSSLLLPVLSKARESARRTQCLNNQKQIGVVMFMYLDNNEGYYPVSHNIAGQVDYAWSWDDKLSDYDGRDLSDADKNSWGFNAGSGQSDGAKLYRCPSDSRGEESGLGQGSRSYSLNTLYTFTSWAGRGITSTAWETDASKIYSRKYSDINQASDSIVITEYPYENNTAGHQSRGNVTVQDLQVNQAEKSFWVHGLWKSNYLFVDGHVSYTYFPSTYAGSGSDPWSATDTRNTMWDCGK